VPTFQITTIFSNPKINYCVVTHNAALFACTQEKCGLEYDNSAAACEGGLATSGDLIPFILLHKYSVKRRPMQRTTGLMASAVVAGLLFCGPCVCGRCVTMNHFSHGVTFRAEIYSSSTRHVNTFRITTKLSNPKIDYCVVSHCATLPTCAQE
jgi:hypothetical protein